MYVEGGYRPIEDEWEEPQVTAHLGIFALSLAFSTKQREWIRKRDDNRCQFPDIHRCEGRNEVHHIINQGYATRHDIDADYPENAITICNSAHRMIHPDMNKAYGEYRHNRGAFEDMKRERQDMMEQGRVYWVDHWDRRMTVIAVRNTQRYKREGHIFPEKNGR